MSREFPVAPWPTSLKVISLFGTLMLVGLSDAAYCAIPTPSGFTHDVGLGVACIPLALLLGCLLFIVTGYRLTSAQLSIHRLLTTTSFDLVDLQRVWVEPAVCQGSIRVFGNGGLFAFCGVFFSQRLGRYRLFATDLRNTVVLQCRDRTVVISPAAPEALVEYMHDLIPGLCGTEQETPAR